MKSPEWICKKNEIRCHILRLFKAYGEDQTYFDEYFAGVLEHDIDAALMCFRDLVKQLEFFKGSSNGREAKGINTKTEQGYKLRAPFNRRT